MSMHWSFAGLFLLSVCWATNRGLAGESSAASDTAGCRVAGRIMLVPLSKGGDQTGGEHRGAGGILVSDGDQVTQTDANGYYHLAEPTTQPFVFFVAPAGYRALESFYHAVPKGEPERTIDFLLTDDPETGRDDFLLAHITDTHVTTAAAKVGLVEDLEIIRAHRPDLVIDTGDRYLMDGDECHYLAAVGAAELPLLHAIGNHDSLAAYQRHFGPAYHAFGYGRYLMVILDSVRNIPEQRAWLQKIMALLPEDQAVLVFKHYPPDARWMRLLTEYNTVAVFSGHWHSSRVVAHDNILSINTPPLLMGGIDTSPGVFRLVRFAEGELEMSDHFPRLRAHCVVVAPGHDTKLPRGKASFLVKAYDAGSTATRVRYRLNDGPFRKMIAVGKFSYVAQETMNESGRQALEVQAVFDDGTVSRTVSFMVTDERQTEPVTGGSWPMFRRDAQRSGTAGDIIAPPFRLAWATPLGGMIHVSSPVVEGGRVYVGVADEERRGLAGVAALDAAGGEVLWRHRTDASVRNTVTVHDNKVYAASVDGKVFALDAAGGEKIWSYDLGIGRWMYAAPLVDDGVVYAGSGPVFVALCAGTGETIWQAERMTGHDWVSCISSPTLGKGKLFVGYNWNGGVFALDRSTGERVWSRTDAGYRFHYATPVFFNNTLTCAMERIGSLFTLNAADGGSLWEKDVRHIIATPLVNERYLIFASRGVLRALDRESGDELWRYGTGQPLIDFYPYGRDRPVIVSSPALSGQVLLFGTAAGNMLALNIEDGKELWSYDVGSPVTSSPAVSGNTVYISSFDGVVYAFTTH